MFGTAFKWMTGGGIGSWFTGGLMSFFGIAAYLASRDHRIRKERDTQWELELERRESNIKEVINETDNEFDRMLDGPDGLRVVTDADPYIGGPVQLDPYEGS